jgi:hypothetical protein
MKRAIPYLRRAVQILSFCFLLYLIIQTAFPLELKIPVDLYLRLDPCRTITILAQKESFCECFSFWSPSSRGHLRKLLLRMVLSHGHGD